MQLLLDGVVSYLPNPSDVTNYAIDNDRYTCTCNGVFNFHDDIVLVCTLLFSLSPSSLNIACLPISNEQKVAMSPQRNVQHLFVGLAFKLEVNNCPD